MISPTPLPELTLHKQRGKGSPSEGSSWPCETGTACTHMYTHTHALHRQMNIQVTINMRVNGSGSGGSVSQKRCKHGQGVLGWEHLGHLMRVGPDLIPGCVIALWLTSNLRENCTLGTISIRDYIP